MRTYTHQVQINDLDLVFFYALLNPAHPLSLGAGTQLSLIHRNPTFDANPNE